jgi:hypothetical protein
MYYKLMADMGLHLLFHEMSLPAIWTCDRREYKKKLMSSYNLETYTFLNTDFPQYT